MSGNRLYRRVLKQISELIESGEFPVGSRLPPERVLAERFEVSRPTIREAVIALEATGKIAVKTGSGMYVTSVTPSLGSSLHGSFSPFELMECRVMIEGEAAALAASLITPEQLRALGGALEKMATENTLDRLGPDCADRKFHAIIAEATNNRMVEKLIESLWNTQDGVDHIKKAHHSICMPNPQVRLDEHRAILEALARHDPPGARIAMRKHFARAVEALHTATEEEAVAEVRRRLSQTRKRFSADLILDTAVDSGKAQS